ncbi:MAG: glycosyltransferase [Oscillospiraceae bacterium]
MEALSETNDNGLRVCLLNDSFPPKIDGVANAVCNYASIIQTKTKGCAMVATPYYPNAKDDYCYPVFRYRSLSVGSKLEGYRAGYPFSASMITEIGKFKPDIIHVHCPFASNILARALREAFDVPIVFTYHTKYDIDISQSFDSKIMKSAAVRLILANIEACDEVWAVSEGAAENLNSLGYRGGCTVMENGVDFPRGRVDDEIVAKVRRENGLSDDIPTFIFVGRMMWYKGIRIILDGLRIAKDRGCRFKMIFVGDGEDFAEIKTHAADIGMEDDCIFKGGIYDREVLRSYFCAADLFIFPSTYDTNGIVVREAAACSVASVLVRGSCAAEGTSDGRNCIHIDENIESLANVIENVCANPEILPKIGKAAATELFISWNDSVTKAYKRYQVIVDNYQKGETNRREKFSDDFIAFMADSMDAVQKIRCKRQTFIKKQTALQRRLLSKIRKKTK